MTNQSTEETKLKIDNDSPKTQYSLLTLGLIVTAIAISLALFGKLPAIPGQPNPNDFTWHVIFRSVNVVTGVFCVAGLILVARNWIATKTFAPHPGYLLGVLASIFFVGTRVVDLYFLDTMSELETIKQWREPAWRLMQQWRYCAMAVAMTVSIVALVGWFRFRWWWRVVFVLSTIYPAVEAYRIWFYLQSANPERNVTPEQMGNVSSMASYVALVWGLGILAAIVCDLVTQTKRDRMHWLGVIIWFLVSFVPTILMMVGLRFLSTTDLFGI